MIRVPMSFKLWGELLLVLVVCCLPEFAASTMRLRTRQPAQRYVFCHFMIGTAKGRNAASTYDKEMLVAKQAGIDAFALNIGPDDWALTQLGYAYASAAKNGMKVFISFDFSRFDTAAASDVARILSDFVTEPAQMEVDGKPFASTFTGDGKYREHARLDLPAVREFVKGNTGLDLYLVPNFQSDNQAGADGLFNWMAWPSDGDNHAPNSTILVPVSAGDELYQEALGSSAYMAPVSPWFSTHYGGEVSYSKNWAFPCDLRWFTRWYQLLSVGSRFVEIISWNDLGESHYVGPALSSPHADDGASKWVNDMPHSAWLDVSAPFIKAFKAGATKPDAFITSDRLVYWYRPSPKSVQCDDTDSCKPLPASTSHVNYAPGKPAGADTLADAVFVVALLAQPGQISISSGGNSMTFEAPAGASSWSVAMGIGKQSFALQRDGRTILSGTSSKEIVNECVCGIYNFNAYVGSLPPASPDALQSEGLEKFTVSIEPMDGNSEPMDGNSEPMDGNIEPMDGLGRSGGFRLSTSNWPNPAAEVDCTSSFR